MARYSDHFNSSVAKVKDMPFFEANQGWGIQTVRDMEFDRVRQGNGLLALAHRLRHGSAHFFGAEKTDHVQFILVRPYNRELVVAAGMIGVGVRIDHDYRKSGDRLHETFQVYRTHAIVDKHGAIGALQQINVIDSVVADAPHLFGDFLYTKPRVKREFFFDRLSLRQDKANQAKAEKG